MIYNLNKYLKLIYVFALFIVSSNSIAQNKVIKGKVLNEYNEPMNDVTIISKNLNKEVISDCNGMFRIEVTTNDSLTFIKERYLSKKVKVKMRYSKFLIIYDYERATKELDENTEDYSHPFGCNPLFVINGDVEYNYNHEISSDFEGLSKKDVNIITLKSSEAEKFGKYAVNGLIWITIKCKRSKK